MTSALEDIKTIDLEEWLTLATAPSPTKLKQGQSPNMKNVWIDEKPGSIITSQGYKKVGSVPSGNPVTFCVDFFKTSSGVQTFVCSDNGTVWTTFDFQTFTPIITGLTSQFQIRGAVIRDKLWLTNGSDAVRTFDGTNVVVLDGSLGATPNVPRGRYISYHDERVWLYHTASNRSAVYFSSLTDSNANIITPDDVNAWDTADNFLQISEGDADYGTGMFLYRGYLYFFKQYSIWRLVGYDEYTYSRVKTRSSTGSRFNESIQILDNLLHLIGIDGIYVFDGEESARISDIIDPATASQTAFGFNQLQQPNSNNQFWEVKDTVDWNAGTVPTNISIDSELDFIAADDSQTDFEAGAVLTNIDTTEIPGLIKLSRQSSGGSGDRVGQGQGAYFGNVASSGTVIYGNAGYLSDGGTSRECGIGIKPQTFLITGTMVIDLSSDQTTHYHIGKIILRGLQSDVNDSLAGFTLLQVNTGNYEPFGGSGGTWITVDNPSFWGGSAWTPHTYVSTFSYQNVIQIRILFQTFGGSFQCSEIEAYLPTYQLTGQFISRTLDYTVAPNSFGHFNADLNDDGSGITFFTQSSPDGTNWDAAVACTNGGSIGSTVRRYLRWGANFTSTGAGSVQILAAYLSAQYISAIHNTAGNIFVWGPFEAPETSYFGQTVNFYYRTATTSGGITGATWNLIVPSGVLTDSVLNQYVQFKIEILGGDATHLPFIPSVTINWISGNGIQPQTLQNVASTYWRNRYWLSAAGPSATYNDTILIRGKKTFGSPWMLKDWGILSFTRYMDSLYGGSSVDGSIYQLDTGYSKDGSAIDSYFETGDFVFGGFTANLIELLIEAERSGPWNLTVGVSVDGGRTWDDYDMDLTPSSYDTNYMKRINLSYTTTRFRLRFRTNGIDTPFQVHRCVAFYKLAGERGSIIGDYLPS